MRIAMFVRVFATQIAYQSEEALEIKSGNNFVYIFAYVLMI